jgi:hypothetical protein
VGVITDIHKCGCSCWHFAARMLLPGNMMSFRLMQVPYALTGMRFSTTANMGTAFPSHHGLLRLHY